MKEVKYKHIEEERLTLLYLILGYPIQQIMTMVSRALNTIKSYKNKILEWEEANGKTLTEELFKQWTDDDIHHFLHSSGYHHSGKAVPTNWEYWHAKITSKGGTIFHTWVLYCKSINNKEKHISYEQFRKLYQQWRGTTKDSVALDHVPGEEVQVDFSGDKASYINPNTLETVWLELFVAVFPFSCFTFAYAVPDQSMRSWIKCFIELFKFVGMKGLKIVNDNLRAAMKESVKRIGDKGKPTQGFRAVITHYSSSLAPARSYKSKDKAQGENHVLISQREILFYLEEVQCYSIEEVNFHIQKLLMKLNSREYKDGREGSRWVAFREKEFIASKRFQGRHYEISEYRKSRVLLASGIKEGKTQYIPPKNWVGSQVSVRVTDTELICTRNGFDELRFKLEPTMKLVRHPGAVEDRERLGMGMLYEDAINWAKLLDKHVVSWIDYNYEGLSKTDPQNGRFCVKLQIYARQYGKENFIKALQFAWQGGYYAISEVHNLLKSKAYLSSPHPTQTELPFVD